MYERPHRKRLRYQGHDYRAPCIVHVTICTFGRQPLFGAVTQEGMVLNNAGCFVGEALRSFHSDADGIAIDTHIVMPDHLHAIIMLGTNPTVDTTASIPELVQRFKMKVMKSWPGGVRARRLATLRNTPLAPVVLRHPDRE